MNSFEGCDNFQIELIDSPTVTPLPTLLPTSIVTPRPTLLPTLLPTLSPTPQPPQGCDKIGGCKHDIDGSKDSTVGVKDLANLLVSVRQEFCLHHLVYILFTFFTDKSGGQSQ